jgi:hypothetical protein
LSEIEVLDAIAALERIGVIVYDRKKQIVFVRGMLARQSPSFAASGNNLLGVSNHIERLPEGSPAIRAFIESQRNVPELFELLEGYLEGESEGYLEQTLDLKTLIPEDKETAISQKDRATTPPSNPSSTSFHEEQSKGNGHGHPAGNEGQDDVAYILEMMPIAMRMEIESVCRDARDGNISRPAARTTLKAIDGRLNDVHLSKLIPRVTM